MKARVATFKSRQPKIPLSKMASADPKKVPRKRRPYMSTLSQLNNPYLMRRANLDLKK